MATKEEEYEKIKHFIESRMREYMYRDDISPSYDQYIQDTKKVKKSKPQMSKEVEDGFQAFWTLFPATSKFTYKGKTFQGERSLKSNKSVCMKLYNEIIQTNAGSQWDISQTLLKALQVQLEHIKIESYKKGDNRMQYLKSCEVYLRQKAYEPWIGEEMPINSENRQQQNTMVSI